MGLERFAQHRPGSFNNITVYTNKNGQQHYGIALSKEWRD